MRLPVYGLYRTEEKLVATIRAEDAPTAKEIFKKHNLKGDIVRRV
jgi:hypothetical protein